VRVGDLFFLSGVDAADAHGNPPQPVKIEGQTLEVLDRIEAILKTQRLNLGNVYRTFMFIPGTEHRSGYRETRRKRYEGIFSEDEFPANSGIYVKDLGRDILLRSVAIAFGGTDKSLITSPKVWLAPGSFSHAFRVGKWLFISGQDAIREVEHTARQADVLSPNVRRSVAYEAEAAGDLAGQTIASLRHVKDIVEQAGGTLDDVVKTTVYHVAGQDRAIFAASYQEFFSSHRKDRTMPAGLSVEVKELAPDCLVEIDAVALLR
jgi:2-iminobutanoate/2-iminopropanoate deaminase